MTAEDMDANHEHPERGVDIENHGIFARKAVMRDHMRAARYAMDAGAYRNASAAAANRLFGLKQWTSSGSPCCYVSKTATRELETMTIISSALADPDKNPLVPITRVDNWEIELSVLSCIDDLVPRTFGVLEPAPEKECLVEVTECDLIVVPCLAVDFSGNRLGYGKGYYDRLLARMEQLEIPKIALAFDFQVVEDVPVIDHDKPVSMIVTERRVIVV